MVDLVVEDRPEVNNLALAQEQQEQQILAVVAVEVGILDLMHVKLVVLVVQE